VDVSVRPWCNYYIDAKINFEGKSWRFTGIYGEPRTKQRNRTWEAIRYLKSQDDLPWLCAGDFNEITKGEEQLGGKPRSEHQMSAFRDCLMDCGLVDLGYKGYDFTWNNRRAGAENIQVRLDRGTATAPFLNLFPLTQVEHIATEESDHMALLIKVLAEPIRRLLPCSNGFKFEEMWIKHDNYEEMVKEAWAKGEANKQGLSGLWSRLQGVTRDMHRWSYETFGSVRAEIKRLRAKLDEARAAARISGTSQEVLDIEHEMHEIF
jgi:hypothetical protein